MDQQVTLSSRMSAVISSMLPKLDATVARRASSSHIDLATAENWLLRRDLIDIYKEAIQEKLIPETLSYAQGLGGDPTLLDALASFFNQYFQPAIPVRPEHVVATPGATSCLDALLTSICDEGDSVLVPAPYWSGFNFHFLLRPRVNIIPVKLALGDKDQGLESLPNSSSGLLSRSLLPALTEAHDAAPDVSPVRALVLTNPHNPFGLVYPKKVLVECMEFCQLRGLHYISDEVYALSEIPTTDADGPRVPFTSALAVTNKMSDVHHNPKVHVIWSISKDLGSSGPRVAALVSQSPLSRPLRASIALLSSLQLSTLAGLATAHLLTSPRLPALLSLRATCLAHHHAIAATALRAWGVPFVRAAAGPFVFARLGGAGYCSRGKEADIVGRLRDAGVLVTGGSEFGGWGAWGLEGDVAGWVRVTVAVPEEWLREGLRRMAGVMGFEDGDGDVP